MIFVLEDVTQIAGSTVTWSSNKIKTTNCLSSTESEYISASAAIREIEWLDNMFQFMKLPYGKVKLLVDNQPAIQLAKYSVFHPRTKHIPLHFHKIRDPVEKGLINLNYVLTHEQLADIMTKPLPKDKFNYLKDLIMVMK